MSNITVPEAAIWITMILAYAVYKIIEVRTRG